MEPFTCTAMQNYRFIPVISRIHFLRFLQYLLQRIHHEEGAMKIVRYIGVFFAAVIISACQSVYAQTASNYFNIQKVADGVYAAIAKPGVLCNGAFVVTNDGVLVVDTHLRPSWAKDLIGAIGKITSQPVRYVVNTHWHGDHTQGNKAYEAAFPKGTEFISHHNTRDDIIGKAIPNIRTSLDSLPVQIGRQRFLISRSTAASFCGKATGRSRCCISEKGTHAAISLCICRRKKCSLQGTCSQADYRSCEMQYR
ncbi:MAG: hypothetical protein HW374_1924 [Bacteroidetes bacterium]|nr:hypothetical protein [Bacteroidota bacterium]